MLQFANLEEISSADIPQLLELITPILNKRAQLAEKYSRGANQTTVMYSKDNRNTVIPFEKFITDLATGYLSGKPVYKVTDTDDEEKARLLNELLDKSIKDDNYKKAMEIVIDYISSYNDDETENYNLIHDVLELTACYELIYENEDNEIVYSRLNPLQTVATWDYNIPANLTGIIRTWDEVDLAGNERTIIEITDRNGTRKYTDNGTLIEELQNHNWGDVPAFAIETETSIFEQIEDIIQAYEQLIQNVRNTYQYNDSDCKLIITGYQPENPMVVTDENGNTIANPKRLAEDNYWINAKTIYTGPEGSIDWLLKTQDSGGVTTILKTYVDLMFQLAGIPNTSDLAFNSTDLNASAIDRKFYVMNMATTEIVSLFKLAYLRRWELIFGRINLKKSTEFDFRDIEIELPKNLPSKDDELADTMMKLRGLISDQTIIEKLGYNYLDEKNKLDEEAQDNILANMENLATMQGIPTEEETEEEITAE